VIVCVAIWRVHEHAIVRRVRAAAVDVRARIVSGFARADAAAQLRAAEIA
jgi:hypothetical protein